MRVEPRIAPQDSDSIHRCDSATFPHISMGDFCQKGEEYDRMPVRRIEMKSAFRRFNRPTILAVCLAGTIAALAISSRCGAVTAPLPTNVSFLSDWSVTPKSGI